MRRAHRVGNVKCRQRKLAGGLPAWPRHGAKPGLALSDDTPFRRCYGELRNFWAADDPDRTQREAVSV